VITGLTRSGVATRRDPEWPDKPQAHANTAWPLFEPRPALRKLIVLADADLVLAENVIRAG